MSILPAEYVARVFLERERLYYQRPFDEFTVERLKQLILRARADGQNMNGNELSPPNMDPKPLPLL